MIGQWSETPLELNVQLAPTEGDLLPNPTHLYIVGCLFYLSVTQLDIAVAVHVKICGLSNFASLICWFEHSSTSMGLVSLGDSHYLPTVL